MKNNMILIFNEKTVNNVGIYEITSVDCDEICAKSLKDKNNAYLYTSQLINIFQKQTVDGVNFVQGAYEKEPIDIFKLMSFKPNHLVMLESLFEKGYVVVVLTDSLSQISTIVYSSKGETLKPSEIIENLSDFKPSYLNLDENYLQNEMMSNKQSE